MNKNTCYTYSIEELKNNLNCWNREIIDKSVMEEIRDTIVANNGKVDVDAINGVLNEVGVQHVDFTVNSSIAYAVRHLTSIVIPEVCEDLEDDKKFMVSITNHMDQIILNIPSTVIEY